MFAAYSMFVLLVLVIVSVMFVGVFVLMPFFGVIVIVLLMAESLVVTIITFVPVSRLSLYV